MDSIFIKKSSNNIINCFLKPLILYHKIETPQGSQLVQAHESYVVPVAQTIKQKWHEAAHGFIHVVIPHVNGFANKGVA